MYKQVKWKGFVNQELTPANFELAGNWLAEKQPLIERLEQVLLQECEIKLSYDEKLKGYRAILFPSPNSRDAGKAMSGLGGTTLASLAVVLIKATEQNILGAWPEEGNLTALEL